MSVAQAREWLIHAAIVAVAVVAVSMAATLALTPRPDYMGIARAPMVQPAPKPAPPKAEPPAPGLPFGTAAQHEQTPAPNANKQFTASLANGGMWQNDADDDQQAQSLCQDLANG